MPIIVIICIMSIITIFRIIIRFQGWYESTIKRLGSSVRHSRSREQEQYTGIPDWLWRHNESTSIDARWPNYDGVHSITSIEHFRRKWIAVNPLHTLVLGVTQHQTIEQCKMALAFGRFLQLQCLKEGSYLKNICHKLYKTYNEYNSKGNKKYIQVHFFWMVTTTLGSRTKVSQPHKYSADR